MIAKGSFRIREIDDLLVVEGSVQFRVAGEKKSIENCRARKKIRITDTMLRVAKVNSFQLTSNFHPRVWPLALSCRRAANFAMRESKTAVANIRIAVKISAFIHARRRHKFSRASIELVEIISVEISLIIGCFRQGKKGNFLQISLFVIPSRSRQPCQLPGTLYTRRNATRRYPAEAGRNRVENWVPLGSERGNGRYDQARNDQEERGWKL